MERSIVTGKAIWELGCRIWDLSTAKGRLTKRVRPIISDKIPNPKSQIPNQKGFSLLELMIAMFILIILLSVAFPTYQRSVQHARETVLKENLWQMRRAIDQFATDKGKMPGSISELVEYKYLREIPRDPITEKEEWNEIQGEDPLNPDGEQGMKDVKSLAEGEDSEGKPYKDY
jgi:general secretion pathway protein G